MFCHHHTQRIHQLRTRFDTTSYIAKAADVPTQGCRYCPGVATLFESVTTDRAFLPQQDPLIRLPLALQAYEDAAQELPKLALGSPGFLRKTLQQLPPLQLQHLPTFENLGHADHDHTFQQQLPPAGACYKRHRQQQQQQQYSCDAVLWRAYMVLSFLTHAYMWCDGPAVPAVLPAVLAHPLAAVAAAVDMPPVLVYATYNLMNWRRLDTQQPLQLGNIACQMNFFGGMDEEWFRLIHIAIEAAAAPAIAALQPLQQAAAQRDAAAMELHLTSITSSLQEMQQLLGRMGERCDPYIYYKRVRVPMSGWRNNPALPNGLVYEGLWDNQPQQLYGETGAQSAVVPALDAALGIKHEAGWMLTYLTDMRAHMPPSHRLFLQEIEAGPSVRAAVQEYAGASSATIVSADTRGDSSNSISVVEGGGSAGGLLEAYNAAVFELERFRTQHRSFANSYIAQWSKKEVGTGGSDFMPALTSYKDATAAHKLHTTGCPLHVKEN